MARRSKSQALSIWSNGERVGTWRMPANGPMELRYDAAWMASPQGRPLSLSLPFRADDAPHAGEQVGHYFENLLPDSDEIRRRLASKFRTASIGAFDLLQAIGRDCVGAVQLLPEDDIPTGFDRIEGTVLDDEAVEQYLSRVVAPAALGMHDADEDDFRLSLAGVQEKTALLRHDGRWLRPHGATPTTHILKLPLGLVGNSRVDATPEIRIRWWPRRARPRADPAPVRRVRTRHRDAAHGAAPVLAARRAGRPRQELQPASAARWTLPAGAAVRRDVDLARRRRGAEPVVVAQGPAGDGGVGQAPAFQRDGAALCGYGRDAEAMIERVLAATADVVDRVGARLPIGFSARVFASVTQGLVRMAAALRRMPAR